MTIDWNAPLEGKPYRGTEWLPVAYAVPATNREYHVRLECGDAFYVRDDGKDVMTAREDRVRNRKPANAPSPELVEVREAIITARNFLAVGSVHNADRHLKRALEELKTADPLQEAADIIQNWRNGNAGEDDALDTARLVEAAIKRVRAEKG